MKKASRKKRIVCLGGGSGGTSTLMRGLKEHNLHITSVTSMADDGGSSGRLRKAYGIMPPGNLVSCIASLIPDEQSEIMELMMYRFPGKAKDNKALSEHKLGNLIMLAEMQRTGDIYKALEVTQQLFGVPDADILPATDERTRLSAITKDGRRIHSETTLDLALYAEPHGLKKIYLTPKKPKVNQKVIDNILMADAIVTGPGDLYTNQLPVLVIPQIKEAILASKAKKIFIGNIANKPFETKGYDLQQFLEAMTEHIGSQPFSTIIANNNYRIKIPRKYKYDYVKIDKSLQQDKSIHLIQDDLIDHDFPIHHNHEKLASLVAEQLGE